MTNDDLLVMLKANLEIITDYMDAEAKAAKDAELTVYIDAAKEYITREGATLSLESVGDCQLIVMYAGWLYDKRKVNVSYGNTVEMPRMLRWNLNNKLLEAKDV